MFMDVEFVMMGVVEYDVVVVVTFENGAIEGRTIGWSRG